MSAAGPAAGRGAARAYCRAVLPRVSRTFAVNIRVLRGSLLDAVRTAYLLCRAADALEDSWPGAAPEVARRFDRLLAAVAGDAAAAEELARGAARLPERAPDLALLAHLPLVLEAHGALAAADRAVIAEALEVMARGMQRYATRAAERADGGAGPVAYLDTEAELHDYCWVVAGCVGVMLSRLFALRAAAADPDAERRLALAPAVGEGLQLTNIRLDGAVDLARGRCHLPAAWLAERGLEARDLAAHPREARALEDRVESLARAALAQLPDYVATIPPGRVRFRLFCLWPALWALASLGHARRARLDAGAADRPRLPRAALWRVAVESLFVAHDDRAVRRMVERFQGGAAAGPRPAPVS